MGVILMLKINSLGILYSMYILGYNIPNFVLLRLSCSCF